MIGDNQETAGKEIVMGTKNLQLRQNLHSVDFSTEIWVSKGDQLINRYALRFAIVESFRGIVNWNLRGF